MSHSQDATQSKFSVNKVDSHNLLPFTTLHEEPPVTMHVIGEIAEYGWYIVNSHLIQDSKRSFSDEA